MKAKKLGGKKGSLKKKKANGLTKTDKAIASMSVDEFLACGLDSDAEAEMVERGNEIADGNGVDDQTVRNQVNDEEAESDEGDAASEVEAADETGSSSEEEIDEEGFQKSLDKLKDSDPTFYKFLQENDKDVMQMQEAGELEVREEEGAGTDSEDSESGDEGGNVSLSLGQITRWEAALSSTNAKSALKEATQAFREAVARVASGASGAEADDPTVFNALVRLCLNEVPRAVASILKLESPDRDPTKNKRWVQVKGPVKRFLTDVIQLLHSAASAGMQRALLRHLLSMTSYLAAEARLSSALVSRLVALWSTGEQEVRVLAFVNLYRLTKRSQATLLDTVLMKAYLAYVKNSTFTSPTSWPSIHLMRRSLVELYCIDPATSYQRAFLYIRQLAIHLRNAKLDKKKFQVVYNWQYVHCLLLWSALVGDDRCEDLRLLLYPLTQIMLGAVNLLPTSRHYPLRFHITRALTQLSAATGTFIPVLPLLLQVLHQTDLNKRNTRVSMRPLDLSCMLRFSAAELKENGFRDGVFQAVLDGLTEYLHVECCTLAFPEMVVMARLQLREFLKNCKVRTYSQRMKELLDAVKAQCEFLERKRQALPFELSDHEAVRRWEQERQAETSPFAAYHASWRQRQQQKQKSTPGKDNKISIESGPTADDSDAEASDDEVRPFNDSDEDGGEEQAESGEELELGGLQPVEDESEEIEDEGDTVEPLRPEKKKKKRSKQAPKPSEERGKAGGLKRKRAQSRGGKAARVR